MRIEVSRERVLLDTGGGLKNAAWFFLDSGSVDEPFILHNVDVISTIDLGRMMRFHIEHDALATLAVQDRATSRYLLFDEQGCSAAVGWAGREGGATNTELRLADLEQPAEVAATGLLRHSRHLARYLCKNAGRRRLLDH